jgi:hypothetical protein
MVSKHRVIKTSIAGGGILSWASKLKTKVEKGMKIGKKIAGVYGSKSLRDFWILFHHLTKELQADMKTNNMLFLRFHLHDSE